MTEGKLHPYYLGINQSIEPARLGDYEGLGYVLQEKFDGWWACLEVIDGGKIHLTTRRNNVIKDAHLPSVSSAYKGTVMIGEWMPKTGEVWVHDLLKQGDEVLRLAPQSFRRYRLDGLLTTLNVSPRIRLVPEYNRGFAALFESIILDGGEGVVLKNELSFYYSRLKSQKTSMWIKCKPTLEQQAPWVGGDHKWTDPDTMAVI